MSRTYATQLDREHYSATFQHELIAALRGRGLQPQIEEVWSVGTIKPGSENSGYLLAVVSHLTAPIEEVDLTNAERKETVVCGCAQYYFDCFDRQVGAPIDECKHCERVQKQRRQEIS